VSDVIVTDRQWLAENLLCLASNAQKYSKTGRVVIRCFLADAKCSSVTGSGSVRSSNSLGKFTDNSTSKVTDNSLNAAMMTSDHMLAFEVIDDGVGINKAEWRSIFEPSRQSSRHMGGTGLGLYALRHRVHTLRGSCGVRDRVDRKPGACFWFTIPYVPAKAPGSINAVESNTVSVMNSVDDESTPLIASSKDTAMSMSQRDGDFSAKILVVDDSSLIRKTAVRALKNAGMASDVAEDGAVCLDKVENGNYRLILMDIQMPVMDGIESTKRIRAMEHETGAPRVAIIGVSANSDGETRKEALAAGMDGFLPKPINLETLRRCLESIDCDLR
jgi:CheY-like chemotaxis protein